MEERGAPARQAQNGRKAQLPCRAQRRREAGRTAIEEREGQHLVGPVDAQTLGAIRLRDFAQQGAREGGIERGLARKGGVGHAQFRLHWRHVSSALQPTGWCPGCQGRAAQRVC